MRAGIKTESVVAAAAEIADRHGWDQITLANVAANLGVKTPSLYNHVNGLPDLRLKLALHSAHLLFTQLTDAAVGRSGKQALIELGKAYIQYAREHPGLYDSINRAAILKLPDFESASQQILNLIVRLMEPFGLPQEDAVHAIRGLRSMIHGFASLEASGGFQMQEDLMDSISKAISFYIDGMSIVRQA